MTNRKLHTPFRFVQRPWMTLNSWYALCYVFRSRPQKLEWRQTHAISGKMYANDSSFWRYEICAIFAEVSRGTGVKRQWGCWQRQFLAFSMAIFWILKRWCQRYYMAICSPSSDFQWSQTAWPWMTLTGYMVLNSVFAQVWLADTVRLWEIFAWKLIKIDILSAV